MESISSPEDDKRQVRGKIVWKSGTGEKKKNLPNNGECSFSKKANSSN